MHYLVSPEFMAQLRSNAPAQTEETAALINLYGYPVSESSVLPTTMWTGKLISKVPFCEFDKEDACWAVPAGLAEREYAMTHCIAVAGRGIVQGMFE